MLNFSQKKCALLYYGGDGGLDIGYWGSSFAKASSYAEASADKTADRSVGGGRWAVGGN
jgi:hypothetical protein